jgi:hypothetical protein
MGKRGLGCERGSWRAFCVPYRLLLAADLLPLGPAYARTAPGTVRTGDLGDRLSLGQPPLQDFCKALPVPRE